MKQYACCVCIYLAQLKFKSEPRLCNSKSFKKYGSETFPEPKSNPRAKRTTKHSAADLTLKLHKNALH